jgi:signal peptidase I
MSNIKFKKIIYTLLSVIILIIIIRKYGYDIYFVSSESMERTLMVNDIVLIKKFNFKLNTNDIIVFNSTDNQNQMIKRVIGKPNETIKIIDTKVFINNNPLTEKDTYLFDYIYNNRKKSFNKVKSFTKNDLLIKNQIRIIGKSNNKIFPKNYNWSLDNFGELWIPKKKSKLLITKKKYKFYKKILKEFELNLDSTKIINKIYTFKENYYFVLGDNRHNSMDSRYFGFIPENQIVGKLLYKF